MTSVSELNNFEASIIYWTEASELTTYHEIINIIQTDKDILLGKSKFSLSDIELQALHFYTPDGAHLINPFTQSVFCAVNQQKHHLNLSKVCMILTQALSKLPNHIGTVYRHDNFDGYEDFLEKHIKGEIIEYSSYLSSSKYDDRFPEGKVLLVILSKTGKDLNWISYSKFYPENEEEVLFMPDTKFLVIERFEKSGRIFITLLEV